MQEDKHRLDELKQSLYRRGQGEYKPRKWLPFTNKKQDVPGDWTHNHKQADMTGVVKPKRSRRNLSVRFFIFSVIFFLISLGIAAFLINRGSNLVSADNIDLVVSGPVSVAGGEPIKLQVDVTNRNNTTLEVVDLLVEFPDGTRDTEHQEELRRTRELLGDLTPGASQSRNISALLFGEEHSQKEISVGIEYRVPGSNAIFFKESIFKVQIGTAPISILVDMPTQTNSGDDVEIVAEVISNVSETLENVVVSVEYPFGFAFKEAQPDADVGDDLWLIGDLEPEGRRTIHILGTLEGQDSEERTFRFAGGLSGSVDTEALATTLLAIKRSITISRPFLQAELTFGGVSGDVYAAEPFQPAVGTITWQNNLPTTVENVVVEASLTGDALNELSVSAQNGFYRSIDNTILWDKSRYSQFARLQPGARGQLTFEFTSQDPRSTVFTEGAVDIELTISGNRIGDTPDTTGPISSSVQKRVQFSSAVDFDSRGVYSVGPLENTGPLPPRPEQPTTYTVIWSVSNTSNDLVDGQVSAALPNYMEWVGTVSPSSENVTFNNVTSEVVWDMGLVSSGSGYTSPPREVAFQVRIVPSTSQLNTAPVILGAGTFTAHDTFTGTVRRAVGRDLTTAITTDPQYTPNDGKVSQ